MSNHNNNDNDDSPLDKTSIMQSDTFKLRLAQAGQAPPVLVLLVGPANMIGRQWPIEDTDRIMGRAATAHVVVEDKSVSKAHAKLMLAAGDVSIVDLESTNKTVLNGKIVPPLTPVKLKNNDQIKLGNIIFKFLERGNIETVSAAQTFDRGTMDALTGIYNRGSLNAQAPEFFNKSNLLGIPLAIVAFDIDHFRTVNNTYGHSAGDYVLKNLCGVIREKLIRGNDFFARYGGEEFCLLLLGSSLIKATEVAERIRTTIEAQTFTFEGKQIPVTISAGVALKSPKDTSWEHCWDRADKALYQSKHSGRNKVTVSSQE